jgi:hypothetical protein
VISGEKIGKLADAAREANVHPVVVAETIIEMVTEESGLACKHCRTLLARQVIAGLLEAGWSMPGDRDGQAP